MTERETLRERERERDGKRGTGRGDRGRNVYRKEGRKER